MKYLVWGTGQIAKENFSQKGIENLISNVVAFVDNDANKVGRKFFEKRIISPADIATVRFDRIIILSSYEKEIRNQIINELMIEQGLIWSQNEFNTICCEMLIDKYDIFNKDILVLGDEKRYRQIQDCYNDLFNIVGIVSIDQMEEIEKYRYDYILIMNLMNIPYLDKKMGRIELENSIIKLLEEKYDVDNMIFTDKTYTNLKSYERVESWGDENPDKTFLLIRLGGSVGLGGCVTAVENGVCYALSRGYIPVVDMMSYHNQYLKEDEVGVVNAWEKFFEQPAGFSLSDVSRSKNVRITSIIPFDTRNDKGFFFLKENPILAKKTQEYIKVIDKQNKRILAVLVRGTDYVQRHPYGHAIQPNIETVIQKVKEKMIEWGTFDKIYLCTEVEEVIVYFQREFGEMVCFYPQRRIQENYTEYLSEYKFDRENDEYYRGEDYWCALKVLAQCDALIAGKCGGTAVALKLNENKYEYTYIFELGRYGIDDVEK